MRLSGRLQLAPTPRVIKQLGVAERFAGEWSRIGNTGVFNHELEQDALLHGAEACLALDSTSPPGLPAFTITLSKHTLRGEDGVEQITAHDESPVNRHLEQFLTAYSGRLTLTPAGFTALYRQAVGGENGGSPFRKEVEIFRAPSLKAGNDETVFPTLSPFLVEQRLAELIGWLNEELVSGSYHPLLVAPLFHLHFLQIFPFPKGNHRLALAILFHVLQENGYPFVRFQHLSPLFCDRSKSYFSALRQAEKTAGTNWSTANVWLEFFFDALLEGTRNLRELGESLLDETRLSDVQRRIIDVVRTRGTASREIIAQETGIHVSTVKYNLSLLSERGHLRRDGGGRSTHYRIG